MLEIKNAYADINIDAPDFWNTLGKDSIVKWNPDGIYDRVFTPEEKNMLDVFTHLPNFPDISEGSIVSGVISKIGKRELVIDITYKDSVYVDINSADHKIISGLEVGNTIEVLITRINYNPYEIKGSVTELLKKSVNEKIKLFFSESESIIAHVDSMIPAGFNLTTDIDGIIIPLFMPNTLAGVNKLTPNQSKALLGQNIEVVFEQIQHDKDNSVHAVNRKKFLQSLIPAELDKLVRGEVYHGYVTGTKNFGIFVEFNECLTGMIHKANLTQEYLDNFDNIKPGDDIEFYVEDISKDNKIILTQKNEETLWSTIKVGQVKEGTVKSIISNGALIALDEKTTALIQNVYITESGKNLNVGDKVNVKIISIIKDHRKIYLSIV